MKLEDLVPGSSYACACTGPFEWNQIQGVFTFTGLVNRHFEDTTGEILLEFEPSPKGQRSIWFDITEVICLAQ